MIRSTLICLSTDQMCPCTKQLFTAYAIVRTEPSATSAIPEEKKVYGDSKLYNSIVEVPARLNLEVVGNCAALLEF